MTLAEQISIMLGPPCRCHDPPRYHSNPNRYGFFVARKIKRCPNCGGRVP